MAQAKKKSTSKSGPRKARDAIALLTDDHKKVKKMFKDFDKLMKREGGNAAKEKLARQICSELTVHARVEEEIFYPAVRDAIDDDDLMDEADVEHASAKDLIAQLESMRAGGDHYDAKVTVLGEYIDHHVKEEQDEMFPKVKKSKVDTGVLGARILQRKQELQKSGGGGKKLRR